MAGPKIIKSLERGLLGIALHPNFPATPYVYLYWTESSTGVDTSNTDDIPLLGNRVDRFIWNGSTLTLDKNIIKLRSLQADAGQAGRTVIAPRRRSGELRKLGRAGLPCSGVHVRRLVRSLGPGGVMP